MPTPATATPGENPSSASPTPCDLLLRNARIFTLDARRTVYPTGAIAVVGNRIAAVGPEREVLPAFHSRRVLDAQGAPVHPGFIDAHFHVSQHSARGFAALLLQNAGVSINFADWKAALRDEDEYASTALACLDLVRNGYTAFVEPGTAFNPDAVAAAAEAGGVRTWLTDTYLWDRRELMDCIPRLISPALEARVPFETDRALRRLGSQLHRNRAKDARLRGYVGLYGLGTASDELQRAAKACADANGVACVQHAGFVLKMTEAEEARLGRPAVVHLAELGVLDRNATLVHLNVVRDAELKPLINQAVSVVWCPANYLLYAAPEGVRGRMAELYRLGVNVGLGVDSAANCAVGDTACFALHAAAQSGEPVSAESILEMLTINAARAIDFADDVGSIESGKRADLVIRRADAPDAQPGMDETFQLTVLSRASSVDTVLVDGRIVLREGRSTLVDEDVIFAAVRASVERMTARLGLRGGGRWPLVG